MSLFLSFRIIFFLVFLYFFPKDILGQMEESTPSCQPNLSLLNNEFSKIYTALQNADVLVIGEEHNDKLGHGWKLAAVERMSQLYNISLSLEMLEWHQQKSLNEYLAGIITKSSFLNDSVFWSNFKEDYMPLIDCAKIKKFPVIAANPSRKYINLIAREGIQAFKKVPLDSFQYLPRPDLLLRDRSFEYEERLRKFFESIPHPNANWKSNIENHILAQHAWDAGMAESIIKEHFHSGNKIIHINGRFHSDYEGGVPYRLKKAGLKVITVSLIPKEDRNLQEDSKIADFVIFTNQPIKEIE